MTWVEGRDVGVGAEAEQHQVESRRPFSESGAQLALVVVGTAGRPVLGVDAMHLGRRREAVERSFGSGRSGSHDAPGSLVRPVDGELILLLDEAAARRLPHSG